MYHQRTMPVLRLGLAILLITAAPLAQQAEIPAAVRAAADKITAEQLKRDLDYLSSDELKGRNTPSPGFDMAADYIAKRLQRAGLKPLGDDGTLLPALRDARNHRPIPPRRTSRSMASGCVSAMTSCLRSLTGAMSGAKPVVYVGHGWTVAGQRHRSVRRGRRERQAGRRARAARAAERRRDPAARQGQRRRAARRFSKPSAAAPPASSSSRSRRVNNWEQMRGQNLTRARARADVPSAYAAPAVASVLLSRRPTDALMAGETVAGARSARARRRSRTIPPSFLAEEVGHAQRAARVDDGSSVRTTSWR